MILGFIGQLLLFILQVTCYASIGNIVLHGKLHNVSVFFQTILAIITGMVCTIALLAIAAPLHIRFVIPLVWIIAFIINIRKFRLYPIKQMLYWEEIVCLVSGVLYALPVFTSAWVTRYGMVFRGVNYYDLMTNVSLTNELVYRYFPNHPGIADVPLRGYHVLYNLLVSEFVRVFHADVIHAMFHWYPLLLGICFSSILFLLCSYAGKSKLAGYYGLLFGMFGGSWVFVYNIIFKQTISLDDGFGITNPASLMVSPSFVYSTILLLYGLYMAFHIRNNDEWKFVLPTSLAFGLLVGIKVYAGMIGLPIWILFLLSMAIIKRRWIYGIGVIVSIGMALLVFLPMNSSYGFLIMYKLWPVYRLMQSNLDWTQWELRRQVYAAHNNWFGILRFELIGLVIFTIGNMGSRIFGIAALFTNRKTWVTAEILLPTGMVIIAYTLGMFFIQPIGAFNMVQVFWYSQVLLGILSAIGLHGIIHQCSRNITLCITTGMCIVTLPTYLTLLPTFIWYFPTTVPMNHYKTFEQLRNIGTYTDTIAYVPFLPIYSEKSIITWMESASAFPIGITNKQFIMSPEGIQFPYKDLVGDRLDMLIQLTDSNLEVAASAFQKYADHNVRYIISEFALPVATVSSSYITLSQPGNALTIYQIKL